MSTNPQKARAELSKQAKEERLKQDLPKKETKKEKELAEKLRQQAQHESKISFIKKFKERQTPKKHKDGNWNI